MTELPIEEANDAQDDNSAQTPPYRSNDLLFTGCLLAPRPSAGILSEANLVIDELEEILIQSGGTLDDVVSIFSLHLDLLTIDQVIETAARRFGKTPPAWTAAGTTGFGLAGTTLGLRVIADLSPGPRRTFQLPGRTGWPHRRGIRQGQLVVCVRADRRSSRRKRPQTNVTYQASATRISEHGCAPRTSRR